MAFINSGASIIRSVLQRNLLNTWSRLYDRTNALPAFEEFHFDRLADERPDLVCYDVVFEDNLYALRHHVPPLPADAIVAVPGKSCYTSTSFLGAHTVSGFAVRSGCQAG